MGPRSATVGFLHSMVRVTFWRAPDDNALRGPDWCHDPRLIWCWWSPSSARHDAGNAITAPSGARRIPAGTYDRIRSKDTKKHTKTKEDSS